MLSCTVLVTTVMCLLGFHHAQRPRARATAPPPTPNAHNVLRYIMPPRRGRKGYSIPNKLHGYIAAIGDNKKNEEYLHQTLAMLLQEGRQPAASACAEVAPSTICLCLHLTHPDPHSDLTVPTTF